MHYNQFKVIGVGDNTFFMAFRGEISLHRLFLTDMELRGVVKFSLSDALTMFCHPDGFWEFYEGLVALLLLSKNTAHMSSCWGVVPFLNLNFCHHNVKERASTLFIQFSKKAVRKISSWLNLSFKIGYKLFYSLSEALFYAADLYSVL